MIDFTTLTANPIPLPISELKTVNQQLGASNESLKKTLSKTNILLYAVLVTSIGFTIYKLTTKTDEKQ